MHDQVIDRDEPDRAREHRRARRRAAWRPAYRAMFSVQSSVSPAGSGRAAEPNDASRPQPRLYLRAGRDYHESWDVESALHPQTIVAYGKDGHLLTPAYGAPARLHSPVKLGYKNTKYLTRVVFAGERNGGYWTDQGYEWYGGT